jgi:hypothetical protein
MMNLDRTYQRALLEEVAAGYPWLVNFRKRFDNDDDANKYLANAFYLEEHGLLKDTLSMEPRITHKGLDFLADDGGLTTILGVVTVKLHEDTLKDLIGQKIAESDLPAPEKSRLLDQIKALPAEAVTLSTPIQRRGHLDQMRIGWPFA